MIAICPAGPPKLTIPSFNQNRNAWPSVGSVTLSSEMAAEAGRCATTAGQAYS
jgi:hypothetical protein